VKTLVHLFESGALTNVEQISVEPDYGFVAQIRYKNQRVRYIRGASMDVNGNAAANIAKDKGYAKRFLTELGYHTPRGKAFVMPRRVAELTTYLETYSLEERDIFEAVPDYIKGTIGLPCFIKPNDESRGTDVYRCTSMAEILDTLRLLETRCYELIIVEEAVNLPEYRVIIFDGQFIACYSKTPLSIEGDCRSTIAELLHAAQQAMEAAGRKLDLETLKPRIESQLKQSDLTEQSILPDGQLLQVLDMANLSVGGSTEDYTEVLHPYWQSLCIRLSRDMNLRLVGIDFMCLDITQPDSEYMIIEINSAPGMYNYACIGPVQAQRIERLYLSIFNSPT
jgi:hypothetical protein